jgi:hypothetical protein
MGDGGIEEPRCDITGMGAKLYKPELPFMHGHKKTRQMPGYNIISVMLSFLQHPVLSPYLLSVVQNALYHQGLLRSTGYRYLL